MAAGAGRSTEHPAMYETVHHDPKDFDPITGSAQTLLSVHPIGSQAGSQAMVDARILTAAPLLPSNAVEALARYDSERQDFGPDAAMQSVEEGVPSGSAQVAGVRDRA